MTAVYVLGTGSQWANNELRFSLRSIEKYLPICDNVLIVGTLPPFVTNCNYIKHPDKPGRKEFSIFSKIIAACKSDYVSEDFVFLNDDHFLLSEINELPYYYEGTLSQKVASSHGHYKAATLNTINELPEEKQKYFDIHCPIIYNKRKFLELEETDWSREYVIKSLYANKQKFITVEETIDLKINKNLEYAEIVAKLEGRKFFSIGDYGINAAMKKVLFELYQNKSKYEL